MRTCESSSLGKGSPKSTQEDFDDFASGVQASQSPLGKVLVGRTHHEAL